MKPASRILFAILTCLFVSAATAEPLLKQVGEFNIPEANQGVGVDDKYFYAIDNQVIAKYDKKSGTLVKKWQGAKTGPIIHLDGATIFDGKIYCPHSNYSTWPMTSSVEIWDAGTMEHIGNHSFGINWGSLTWVDFHNGSWWATFANYDKLYGPGKTPYGYKAATQLIKFSADWAYQESWILPNSILDRFEDMSNSGGSWGPDGYLYLSGHDPAEIYKMRFPEAGSILELVSVLPMNIRGQGIAWDRSDRGVIYGIIRATAQEKAAGGSNKVTVFKLEDATR